MSLFPVIQYVMEVLECHLENLLTLIDKKEKPLAINWDDEIVKGTLLTRDGAIVHPNFKPKS